MAEYIELSQATTLFGDVDARFDTVEGKIPSNASSGNKMVTASDIATKADLVNGLVPANQLPSFVDDVLMGTAQNITETAAGTYSADGFIISGESTPATLEDGKTYVDTATNIQFRYTGTGSDLVSMGSNLALGETATTAYAGNKGKANADAISDIQDLIPSGASTSNKLATASDIPDTSGLQPKTLATTIGSYTTVEGALSGINDGKVDKVTGKGLSTNDYTTADQTALQTTIPLEISQLQASLLTKADVSSVPTALSDLTDDSTHRVVTDTEKTAWSGKQDALTFDNAPTANSDNPVKSGGIKTALDSKVSYTDNGVLGVKNRFKLTDFYGGKYLATITNDGKEIEIKETNANTDRKAQWNVPVEPNTDWVFSCDAEYTSGVGMVEIYNSDNSSLIVKTDEFKTDTTVNLEFNSGNNDSIIVKLYCTTNVSEVGDVFYNNAMLILATDTDSTWWAYSQTNRETTHIIKDLDDNKVSYDYNSIIGAHNWFNYKVGQAEGNTALSYADNGKYINVHTTNNYGYRRGHWDNIKVEPNKDYKIICGADITSGKAYIEVKTNSNANIITSSVLSESGNIELLFNTGSNTEIKILLYCTFSTVEEGNVTYTSFMLLLASDSSSQFAGYSMTNQELSQKVLGIIDAANNSADYSAFKAAIAAL